MFIKPHVVILCLVLLLGVSVRVVGHQTKYVCGTFPGLGSTLLSDGSKCNVPINLNGSYGIAYNQNNGLLYLAERNPGRVRLVPYSDTTKSVLTAVKYLNSPRGLYLHQNAVMLVADRNNHVIKQTVLVSSITTTYIGTGASGDVINVKATFAALARPNNVVRYSTRVYVADTDNYDIKRLHVLLNIVSLTFAFDVSKTSGDKPLSIQPYRGYLYCVFGTGNHAILRVPLVTNPVKETFAGSTTTSGDSLSPIRFNSPESTLTVCYRKSIFIADTVNNEIKEYSFSSGTASIVVGSGSTTWNTAASSFGYISSTSYSLPSPRGIALGSGTNRIVVTDGSNRISETVIDTPQVWPCIYTATKSTATHTEASMVKETLRRSKTRTFQKLKTPTYTHSKTRSVLSPQHTLTFTVTDERSITRSKRTFTDTLTDTRELTLSRTHGTFSDTKSKSRIRTPDPTLSLSTSRELQNKSVSHTHTLTRRKTIESKQKTVSRSREKKTGSRSYSKSSSLSRSISRSYLERTFQSLTPSYDPSISNTKTPNTSTITIVPRTKNTFSSSLTRTHSIRSRSLTYEKTKSLTPSHSNSRTHTASESGEPTTSASTSDDNSVAEETGSNTLSNITAYREKTGSTTNSLPYVTFDYYPVTYRLPDLDLFAAGAVLLVNISCCHYGWDEAVLANVRPRMIDFSAARSLFTEAPILNIEEFAVIPSLPIRRPRDPLSRTLNLTIIATVPYKPVVGRFVFKFRRESFFPVPYAPFANFSIEIEMKDPPAKVMPASTSALQSAATAIALAMSASSILSLSGSSATIAGRLHGLSAATFCDLNPLHLGRELNPTQLRLPFAQKTLGIYTSLNEYAGTIVGDGSIIVGVILIHFSIVYIVYTIQKYRKGGYVNFSSTCGTLYFPSFPLWIMMYFGQTMISAAAYVTAYSPEIGPQLFGVFVLSVSLLSSLWIAHITITKGALAKYWKYDYIPQHKKHLTFFLLFHDQGRWFDKSARSHKYCGRFGSIFYYYKPTCQWFTVIEILFMAFIAVGSSLQPRDRDQCVIESGTLFGVFGLYMLVLMKYKPYHNPRTMSLWMTVSIFETIAAGLGTLAAANLERDDVYSKGANSFVLLSACLAMIEGLFSIITVIYGKFQGYEQFYTKNNYREIQRSLQPLADYDLYKTDAEDALEEMETSIKNKTELERSMLPKSTVVAIESEKHLPPPKTDYIPPSPSSGSGNRRLFPGDNVKPRSISIKHNPDGSPTLSKVILDLAGPLQEPTVVTMADGRRVLQVDPIEDIVSRLERNEVRRTLADLPPHLGADGGEVSAQSLPREGPQLHEEQAFFQML